MVSKWAALSSGNERNLWTKVHLRLQFVWLVCSLTAEQFSYCLTEMTTARKSWLRGWKNGPRQKQELSHVLLSWRNASMRHGFSQPQSRCVASEAFERTPVHIRTLSLSAGPRKLLKDRWLRAGVTRKRPTRPPSQRFSTWAPPTLGRALSERWSNPSGSLPEALARLLAAGHPRTGRRLVSVVVDGTLVQGRNAAEGGSGGPVIQSGGVCDRPGAGSRWYCTRGLPGSGEVLPAKLLHSGAARARRHGVAAALRKDREHCRRSVPDHSVRWGEDPHADHALPLGSEREEGLGVQRCRRTAQAG